MMAKKRVKFVTDARVEEIREHEGAVRAVVTVGGGEARELAAEKVLIAVGRRPVIEDLGLEELGVRTSRGHVAVDPYMRTSVPGVFAVGDVVPTQALAHLASHEGILAMECIAGRKAAPINYDLVPSCTFSRPEVASVGLSETAARERGFDVLTARFPFAAVSKASILGENEGFVKLVSERSHKQILGVHMVGPQVTELIAEGAALIGLEATAADVSHLIHPHPTVSEGIMEAAHALYGGAAIHI
jgi:dihydrolipoamide dehydrogenase